MAEKSYNLDFDGYLQEVNWSSLPAKSGVYCVYACTYSKKSDKVSIWQLLYIGESGDIKKRVPQGRKTRRDVWASKLKKGEELCVSWTEVGYADRERVEAALIYYHEPPCNDEYVASFPFDKTNVTTEGKTAKLSKKFIVRRDD